MGHIHSGLKGYFLIIIISIQKAKSIWEVTYIWEVNLHLLNCTVGSIFRKEFVFEFRFDKF